MPYATNDSELDLRQTEYGFSHVLDWGHKGGYMRMRLFCPDGVVDLRSAAAGAAMKSDFDKVVKTFRKHFNLTQTELADAIGTRQSTIVRWESGAEPRVDGFQRLAAFALSKGYNIESPWDSTESSLLLVGEAKQYGEISRVPANPELPDVPLKLSVSSHRMNRAIEITGNKLEPRFLNGDLACFNTSPTTAIPVSTGIVIVSLRNGGLYLHEVNQPDSLEGPWLNTRTGQSVEPEWGGALVAIIPAGGWSRATRGLSTRPPASALRKK